MHAGGYLDVIEEVGHDFGTLLELLGIRCRPPVFEVAVLIELTSLIIEAVSHLMADHNPYCPVVESVIGIHIEERILKNPRRKANLVRGGIIVSIHGLRRHIPFVPIDGLRGLIEHLAHSKLHSPFDIRKVRIFFYLKRRIIFPFVGVTDLHIERIQFIDCFGFRRIAHPVEITNPFGVSILQVMHEVHHALFGFGWEIFRYI